jgi:hypothetical protein
MSMATPFSPPLSTIRFCFLADEPNAVTDLKAFRIGERNLLVPMVAIHDELRGGRWLFDKDRVGSASSEADL